MLKPIKYKQHELPWWRYWICGPAFPLTWEYFIDMLLEMSDYYTYYEFMRYRQYNKLPPLLELKEKSQPSES